MADNIEELKVSSRQNKIFKKTYVFLRIKIKDPINPFLKLTIGGDFIKNQLVQN